MEKIGAVYGVSKLPWLLETLISAISFRKHMPEIPIELSIEKNTHSTISNHLQLQDYFTYVNVLEEDEHWRTPKFAAINSTRFEKTLFLDGDTYFTDRIDELFELLDAYDIVAMPAIQKLHRKSITSGVLEIFPETPDLFPEFNGGVVLYNNHSQKIINFKKLWYELYEQGRNEKEYSMDQASMRVAMFHSGIKLFSLYPEYNFRANVPNVVKEKVKIIHAHGNLAEIARLINIDKGKIRIWKPQAGLVYGFMPKNVSVHKDLYSDEENEVFMKNILSTIEALK